MAVTFKITDKVQQQICVKFCVKIEHSSMKLFRWFGRQQLLGNWWLAAACLCITSCAELSGETLNQPGDSAPYSPDLETCDWLFPKLKLSLKEKRFQTVNEIQENMMGKLMQIERTMWGAKVPTLKGTEVSLFYVQCFLYLTSSSINVSIFHITCLDTFWTDLIYGQVKYDKLICLICNVKRQTLQYIVLEKFDNDM